MKTLIILGNGKSLADVDLTTLSNYDTFGLNGAFIKYQQINWFPKYFGFLTYDYQFWDKKEVLDFIKNNYIKCDKFFCMINPQHHYEYFKNMLDKEKYDKIQFITPVQPTDVKFDTEKFTYPLMTELIYLREMLAEKYTHEEIIRKMSKVFESPKWKEYKKLNATGWYKLVEDFPIDSGDYISLPRFNIGWIPPTNFDNFVNVGGNSGYFATLIGYLMGYKKIILLGFDFNFEVKNDVVDTTKTFWFDDYFHNKDYNVKHRLCPTCDKNTLTAVQQESFELLKNMIEIYKLDLDVVNCTKGSKLEVFRKSTLEKEL